MAKNFRIHTRAGGKHRLQLQLQGDFDGSSAWDLLKALEKIAGKYSSVSVTTDHLRHVNEIGFNIVASKILPLSAAGTKITFTGKHGEHFSGA